MAFHVRPNRKKMDCGLGNENHCDDQNHGNKRFMDDSFNSDFSLRRRCGGLKDAYGSTQGSSSIRITIT